MLTAIAALSLCHLVSLCTAALVSWLCFGGEPYGAALIFVCVPTSGKTVHCGISRAFLLERVYRSSLVFARALAILLLSCPSSFAVRTWLLLPCVLQCVFMITVAFCGHLPLQRCRSADAVISTGGFPSAACTVLHIHAIYRRMVAVLFLRRFLTCFACFMRTVTGKTAFR